jgi:hypothetical protein
MMTSPGNGCGQLPVGAHAKPHQINQDGPDTARGSAASAHRLWCFWGPADEFDQAEQDCQDNGDE